MTPLAREIYRQLVRLVRANQPSTTYAELAAAVSKKHPTHHRSPSFHSALGEVTTACRVNDLPCLPAIVWRSAGRRPGRSYYAAAHPRAKTEEAQLRAWEREHTAVIRDAARFPVSL